MFTAEEDRKTIESLTLEQKIGQMIMGRGLNLYPAETRAMIRAGRMANIQAHDNHNEREALAGIQRSLPLPMLVGADMENGFCGPAFKGAEMPCAMALGAVNDEKTAYEWAAGAAREARSYGINLVYGPVVDCAIDPESPLVNIRAISSNFEVVIRLAAAMVRGYQDNGMIVAAKHYPGAGRSPVDSHIEECRLQCSRQTFQREELRVYRELARRAKLSGVMSGHILAPCIDANNMATTSPALVRALRKQGFDGLLMTDSLAMKGLKSFVAKGDLLPAVLASGHDLILIDYSQPPERQFRELLKAVQCGHVPLRAINESVERVLRAKRHIAGILPKPADKTRNRALALEINRRAVTVTGKFKAWPSVAGCRESLIIVARERKIESVRTEVGNNAQSGIEKLLRRRLPVCDLVCISDNPSPFEIEKLLDKTVAYRHIVFIAYALPHSYKGTADLSRPLLALISGLRHKIDCLVLFGNPFAARHLPELPVVMFPYWGGSAEQAAVETLAGENKPRGNLPVKW